jgi:hypothetical protein
MQGRATGANLGDGGDKQWWSYSDSFGWATRENNLKLGCYSANYSSAAMLNGLFSEISGWAMAHPAHHLDSPLETRSVSGNDLGDGGDRAHTRGWQTPRARGRSRIFGAAAWAAGRISRTNGLGGGA